MTYETALKLKEAGWKSELIKKHPALLRQEFYASCSLCGDGAVGLCETCVIRNYTTLSELIEACGDKFRVLYFKEKEWKNDGMVKMNQWQAGEWIYWDMEEVGDDIRGVGSTPEEAVANLWIKLNQKK